MLGFPFYCPLMCNFSVWDHSHKEHKRRIFFFFILTSEKKLAIYWGRELNLTWTEGRKLAGVHALHSDHRLWTLFLGHGRNKEQFSHALEVALLSANLFNNIMIHCGGAHAAKGYLELTVRFRSFSHSKLQCSVFYNHLSELSVTLSLLIASLWVPELLDMAPVKEVWWQTYQWPHSEPGMPTTMCHIFSIISD